MLARPTIITPDVLADLVDKARHGILVTDSGVTPEVQQQLDDLAAKADAPTDQD